MEHQTNPGAVGFPVGGQEEHAFIWIAPDRTAPASPGRPLGQNPLGSTANLLSLPDNGFFSIPNGWDARELMADALDDQCYEDGGFVRRFPELDQTHAIFTAAGDCISIEAVGDNYLVADLATGERMEPTQVVASSSKLKGTLGRAIARVDMDGSGFFATTHPGSSPRYGRREPFRLFRHVNISNPVPLDDAAMGEFSSTLACLVMLLGSGGLGPSGFCLSPVAAATVTRRALRNWFAPPYVVVEKKCNVLSVPPDVEPRMHVCLDPPFTPMGSAIGFFCVQLLYTMLSNNRCPLGARRLSNPAQAAHTWASRPGTSCSLAGGGKANAWDLASEFGVQLERFRREVCMDSEHEALVDLLARGVAAAVREETEEGFLATHFEYYRKRDLYERTLRQSFGITLERFNTLARSLFLAGIPPFRLEQMSSSDITDHISEKSPSSRARFEAFMERSKLTYDDLRSAASCFRKMEQLELALGALHPKPEEQVLPDAEQVWRQFMGEYSHANPTPTRADARARLVSYAKSLEVNPACISMDWANTFCWPGNDDMLEVIVSPLGPPDSPGTTAEMVHLKFRQSDIRYVMQELPSARPFRAALRNARFHMPSPLGRSARAYVHERRDGTVQPKLFNAYAGLLE